MTENNWGHSINIWIAVEGDRVLGEGQAIIDASAAAEKILEQHGLQIEFVGASIKGINEKPYDQIAT